MRFRSKHGSRANYIMLGQVGGILAMIAFWRVGAWPMVVLCVIVLSLALWTVLGTRYVIRGGVLDARSGPLRMRVPLRDITAVHRRTVDRGVTLGLGDDYIGIEYGANALNVSPLDADGFVEAVMAAASTTQRG